MPSHARNPILMSLSIAFVGLTAACSDDATSSSSSGSSGSSSSGSSGAADAAPEASSSGGAECTGKTFSASCKIGPQCADFYGMSESEAQSTCDGAKGTLDKTGKCARTDLSGGCEHTEGNVCSVKWYPSSSPANIVQAGCKSPDTFRTP